jgi:aminocarboxymuconate-semialdehyde decarboxylase
MTVIDVHTHFIPKFVLEEAAEGDGVFGVRAKDGRLAHPEGFSYPVDPEMHDAEVKLRRMDEAEIDVAVLSIIPPLFFYEQPADRAVEFAARANDALADMIEGHDRLLGVATLPLQAPEEAAAELERAIGELGLRGAQIGTDAGAGRPLDSQALHPVYAAAESHDLPIVLHPSYVGLKPGLEDFYFTNSIGNPLETMIAAARLIHGGTLDRFPSLKLVLVHAGGFLPYQVGRLDHAYEVRSEPKVSLDRPPSEYLDRFHMDTITHARPQLDFLASLIGTERLVLGTDIPFDMGDARPLDLIRGTSVDEHAIGATAQRLLRLDGGS